uniref:CUB domain-containing protein n=1 Tax=Macrostomum lignano TaxID=282301 RepID=A0A1I8GS19_9PLAT
CCSGRTLYSSSGTIACPSSGGQYSNNLDVSWSIRPRGVSRIRFSKLDVDSCCDKVLIYESAIYASSSSEKFRLVHANATESEFWVNSPFVVRFRSDGFHTRSGFRLSYERQWESIPVKPASLEISLIKPELWSLSDSLIRFRAVSQAECRRVRHRCELRLFNGSAVTAVQVKRCVSRVQTDFTLLAELIDTVNSTIICYKQAGTVNYSLPAMQLPVREIQWRFPESTEIAAGAPMRILLTTAASIRGLSAKCRLHQECENGTIEVPIRVFTRRFTCYHRIESSRHLREKYSSFLDDGSVKMSRSPSGRSSVMSQFLACRSAIRRSSGSTVRRSGLPQRQLCRLLNGSSALLVLPEKGFGETRLAEVWERPLLAASSTTAVLAIIALVAVVACFVLMRSGRWPPWKKSPDASVPDDSTGVYVT